MVSMPPTCSTDINTHLCPHYRNSMIHAWHTCLTAHGCFANTAGEVKKPWRARLLLIYWMISLKKQKKTSCCCCVGLNSVCCFPIMQCCTDLMESISWDHQLLRFLFLQLKIFFFFNLGCMFESSVEQEKITCFPVQTERNLRIYKQKSSGNQS